MLLKGDVTIQRHGRKSGISNRSEPDRSVCPGVEKIETVEELKKYRGVGRWDWARSKPVLAEMWRFLNWMNPIAQTEDARHRQCVLTSGSPTTRTGNCSTAHSWIITCLRAWTCRHRNGARRNAFAAQPDGVKGAGEAGAIPVGPLFAQALEDALYDVDFEILEIPLNSNRLWELVSKR